MENSPPPFHDTDEVIVFSPVTSILACKAITKTCELLRRVESLQDKDKAEFVEMARLALNDSASHEEDGVWRSLIRLAGTKKV